VRLGDNNFLNLFSRVAAHTNSNRDCDEWRIAGVHWMRQRLVNWGSNFSFQIETHILSHPARSAWTLLCVHELWWGQARDKTIRNTHWVRLQSGSRKDALNWFAARQQELDR
jgi:hypothetical protein